LAPVLLPGFKELKFALRHGKTKRALGYLVKKGKMVTGHGRRTTEQVEGEGGRRGS